MMIQKQIFSSAIS